MQAEALHNKLREKRDNMNKNHAVRLHRAISWLKCAETYSESDDDVAIITVWVSFNACYAIDEGLADLYEKEKFGRFSFQVCELDEGNNIYNLLWVKFGQFVRLLLDNQYIYAPFWRDVKTGEDSWQEQFSKSNRRALSALKRHDTPKLLEIVLDRLYVLRNQLVHGGATYNSYVNRDQVRDGKNLLLHLMPIIIEIMMEHTEVDWGEIYFPVVEDSSTT